MLDADDWAKEDCECGHRRFNHARGIGTCNRTRVRRVPPEGLTWTGDVFFGEPSIPVEQWPEAEGTCCGAFREAGLALAEDGPW